MTWPQGFLRPHGKENLVLTANTLAIALFVPALLAAPAASPLPASLQTRVASARSPELKWPDWNDYRGYVKAFYQHMEGRPAWTQAGAPTPQARALAAILASADLKGLNAADYEGDRWPSRMAALSDGPVLEAFDVAFTVSVLRYLSDLRLGRINPAKLEQGFSGKGRRSFLVDAAVALTTAVDPRTNLDALEPAQPGYRALEALVPRYLDLARRPVTPLHALRKHTPGVPYADAQPLADLLVALGDLPAEAAKTLPPGRYDPVLAAAVGRYQVRHGLPADGRLGPKTLMQLRTPLSQRLTQLRLTLERWRWAVREPAPRMIVVNVPAFSLSALSAKDTGYQTDLWMRVVVGQALKHETHLLTGRLEDIIFRPTWDVPTTILQKELLPQLRRHPALLGKEDYEIVKQAGGPDQGPVTRALLKGLAAGTYRLVQKPGLHNALGHIKFLFSNAFELYLHDTPARTAFASSRRDFSHGCVRLERPADLAAWILRDTPGWTADKIKAEMEADAPPLKVPIPAPIQVVILYGTATVDGAGLLYFYDDIYGEDKQLALALEGGYPYAW